jgi:hypothetical protein
MILEEALELRLSGGANNSIVESSIGGPMSTFTVSKVFNNISLPNTNTEYKCIYLYNYSTETIEELKIFCTKVFTKTPGIIKLGKGEVNTEAELLNSPYIAPNGISMSIYRDDVDSLLLGDLPSLAYIPIWISRTCTNETIPGNYAMRLIFMCKAKKI